MTVADVLDALEPFASIVTVIVSFAVVLNVAGFVVRWMRAD